MVHGFTSKKIKSKTGLGSLLKKERLKKKVTILEVEVATKVRAKYLEAMESSKWNTMPQSVYVRGFVLAYAKYLEVPTDEALSLFERESRIFFNKNVDISYKKTLHQKKVLVTPKILAYSSLAVFIVFLLSYVVIQLFNFAGTPNLKITSPSNNTISELESINLDGLTDVDTKVTINNENIPVSDDGKFSLNLKLRRGINVLKVVAVNKVKKETTEVFTVEYKPKTAEAVSSTINQ